MGKSLSDKIKELPLESQIKIEQRTHELIALELTRQKLRQYKLRLSKFFLAALGLAVLN